MKKTHFRIISISIVLIFLCRDIHTQTISGNGFISDFFYNPPRPDCPMGNNPSDTFFLKNTSPGYWSFEVKLQDTLIFCDPFSYLQTLNAYVRDSNVIGANYLQFNSSFSIDTLWCVKKDQTLALLFTGLGGSYSFVAQFHADSIEDIEPNDTFEQADSILAANPNMLDEKRIQGNLYYQGFNGGSLDILDQISLDTLQEGDSLFFVVRYDFPVVFGIYRRDDNSVNLYDGNYFLVSPPDTMQFTIPINKTSTYYIRLGNAAASCGFYDISYLSCPKTIALSNTTLTGSYGSGTSITLSDVDINPSAVLQSPVVEVDPELTVGDSKTLEVISKSGCGVN